MNQETKKKPIWLWIVIALVVACGIYFATTKNSGSGDKATYNTAVQKMEEKDFEGAIKEFEKVEDYNDSKALIQDCYYKLGKAAEKEQKFEEAVNFYGKCDESFVSYKDAHYSMQWSKLQYLLAHKDDEQKEDIFNTYVEDLKNDEGFKPAVDSIVK